MKLARISLRSELCSGHLSLANIAEAHDYTMLVASFR
jgi:hypothetical protein